MTDYLKDLLRLPTGVRRFLMTEALYGIAIGMYSLVLNLHLLSKGLREDQIGALASTGILVMGALAIPVAVLAGKVGRKKLLVAGILVIACGIVLYALSDTIAVFYLAQALVSIGFTLVETTEVQLLFHYCSSRKDETRAFSLMFAVFTAFTGAGTLLAGYLPRLTGEGSGYLMPLLAAGGILLLQGMLRGIWLPAERKATANAALHSAGGNATAGNSDYDDGYNSDSTNVSERPSFGDRPARRQRKLPGRTVWLFSVLLALLGGALAMTGSFLNVIVKYRLEWPDGNVSLLLAAAGIVLFVSSLLTPYVVERFGSNKAVVSVFLMNILVFAALSCLMPVWLFAVLFLFRGGGSTMLSNIMDSQLMSAFKERERNLFAGMRAVFRSVGSSGATYLAGWILAGGGFRLPFLLTAALLAAALLYYLRWVRPVLERRLGD